MSTIIVYRRQGKQRVWTRDSIAHYSQARRHLSVLRKANPDAEFRAVDVFGNPLNVEPIVKDTLEVVK